MKLAKNQINEFVLSLAELGYTKAEALNIIQDAETRAQFCVENATDYNDAVEILGHSLQYETYILNSDMLDVAEDIIWLLMPE
jgi:hypothetical protein